ncbi:MmgE/PrpD family protein [Aurantivibrio infirmus]
METGISQQLAAFVVHTKYEDLNRAAVEATKRCLLDGLGVSLAASGIGEGVEAFEAVSAMQESKGSSSLFGLDKKTSSVQAALVNGALAHALDFEDAHDETLMHPNAASIPAAIAVSEELGNVSGKELITAIAVACDVVCRLASAVEVPLDDFGWYPPPIFNVFGATAAAAKLYGLTEREALSAFSIALCNTSCSAEIKHNPSSVIRAIRDAFPAHMGVLAAQLAKQGVNGFDQPFEGKAGFFNNFLRGNYKSDPITADLGKDFYIENISLKPWPSCRGTHAFIEAIQAAMEEHNFDLDSIEKIVCSGSRINRMLAEPIESKRSPQSAIDAKFSIPYVVALTLHHGEVVLDHFLMQQLDDAEVLKTTKKIQYQIDTQLGDGPEGMTSATVEIILNDGRSFGYSVQGAYGNPDKPLSDVFLKDKFMQCCRLSKTLRSEREYEELYCSLLDLEKFNDLSKVLFCHL